MTDCPESNRFDYVYYFDRIKRIDLALLELGHIAQGYQDEEEYCNSILFIAAVLRSLE